MYYLSLILVECRPTTTEGINADTLPAPRAKRLEGVSAASQEPAPVCLQERDVVVTMILVLALDLTHAYSFVVRAPRR